MKTNATGRPLTFFTQILNYFFPIADVFHWLQNKIEPMVSNQLVGTPFFCQVATKISAACFLWLDSIHPSNSSLYSLDMTII